MFVAVDRKLIQLRGCANRKLTLYGAHIGNQYFASFHSSMSKSRVNFSDRKT